MPSSRSYPLLPTQLETALLSIYPVTLLMGTAFSYLNPTIRRATYDPSTQSYPPDAAPSYFAKKSNLVNQLFVKQGWFWISASFLFLIFTHPFFGPSRTTALTTRRLKALTRWAMCTTLWFWTTQWFFGPPIIDRSFKWTGGQCELVAAAEAGRVDLDMHRAEQYATHVACKAVGGSWSGGHDISGHVFLLVLGSTFLLEEILHVLVKRKGDKEMRTVLMRDGAVADAGVEAVVELKARGGNTVEVVQDASEPTILSVKIAGLVAGLCVFMLAMTAIYFHTWFEKLTGLLVAFSGIFVVYFLPRVVPAMRNITGLPGI